MRRTQASTTALATGAVSASPRRPLTRGASILDGIRAFAGNPWGQVALVALLYFGYASYLTWPLLLNMHSGLFGSAGNDEWALLAYIREFSQHGHTPFTPETIHAFAAPEGFKPDWALNITNWPSWIVLYLLALPFREVFALDAFVLLGYTLNGVAMFMLVRRITRNPAAAVVAGFAFAFFPFAVIKGQIHEQFMHVWVLALMAWRLLELSERPSVRNGVWAGLASIVALSWTSYFVVFGGLVFASFLVFDFAGALFRRARRHRLVPLVKGYAAACALLLAMVAVYGLIASTSSSNALATHRPLAELYVYSARPLEYLLPDARNLIFGSLTSKYLFTHAHGSGYGEFNLYVGLIPLALAAAAFIALVRRRLAPELRRPLLVLALVSLVAAWFSAPPTTQFGSLKLYYPSYVVHHFEDGFRVYSRLVDVVMVGVAAGAGIGLAHLLRGRTARVQAASVVVLIPLIALDLWARPPVTVSKLPHPRVYKILKHEPPGIVAEYPLTPAEIPSYEPMLDQPQHGHPILNGFAARSNQEARALDLTQLSDPRTAPRLALLGVRYIVVNEGPPPEETAPPAKPGRGFKLIADLDQRALYRVTAPPAPSWVSVGGGFSGLEAGPHHSEFHWLNTSSSSLEIRATCRVCSGTLKFQSSSFLTPRTLTIKDPSGHVLLKRQISTGDVKISVPVHFAGGEVRLPISITPGPVSAVPYTHGTDLRDLGILVSDAQFVPAG